MKKYLLPLFAISGIYFYAQALPKQNAAINQCDSCAVERQIQKALNKKRLAFHQKVGVLPRSVHTHFQHLNTTSEEIITDSLPHNKRLFRIKKQFIIAKGTAQTYVAFPVGLLQVTTLSNNTHQYSWVNEDWTLDTTMGQGVQIKNTQKDYTIQLSNPVVYSAVSMDERFVTLSFNVGIVYGQQIDTTIEVVEPKTKAKDKTLIHLNPTYTFYLQTKYLVLDAVVEGRKVLAHQKSF